MLIVFMTAIQCFHLGAMPSERVAISSTSFQTYHLPEVSQLLMQTMELSAKMRECRETTALEKNKEVFIQLIAENEKITGLVGKGSEALRLGTTWISKALLGKYFEIISKDTPYNSEIVAALLHAQTEQKASIPSDEVWFITHDFQDKLNEIITGKSEDIETMEKTRIEQLETEFRDRIERVETLLTTFVEKSVDEVSFVNRTIDVIKKNLAILAPYMYQGAGWVVGNVMLIKVSGPFTPYPTRSEEKEPLTSALVLIQ